MRKGIRIVRCVCVYGSLEALNFDEYKINTFVKICIVDNIDSTVANGSRLLHLFDFFYRVENVSVIIVIAVAGCSPPMSRLWISNIYVYCLWTV